jgi:signal transduction histidine kinase
MSIVKEILEYHGGYVDIRSEQNVGTSVTLWFPDSAKAG